MIKRTGIKKGLNTWADQLPVDRSISGCLNVADNNEMQ